MKKREYELLSDPYIHHIINLIEKKEIDAQNLNIDTNYILTISTYFYLQGKSNQAIDWLQHYAKKYPKPDVFLIKEVQIFIMNQRFLRAIEILKELKQPNAPAALFEHIKITILTNQLFTAKNYCQKLFTDEEARKNYGFELTFFLAYNHRIEDAKDCLKWISSTYTDKNKFLLAKLALAYEENKEIEACNLCNELINNYPDNFIVWLYNLYLHKKHYKNVSYYRIKLHITNRVPHCKLLEDIENNRKEIKQIMKKKATL